MALRGGGVPEGFTVEADGGVPFQKGSGEAGTGSEWRTVGFDDEEGAVAEVLQAEAVGAFADGDDGIGDAAGEIEGFPCAGEEDGAVLAVEVGRIVGVAGNEGEFVEGVEVETAAGGYFAEEAFEGGDGEAAAVPVAFVVEDGFHLLLQLVEGSAPGEVDAEVADDFLHEGGGVGVDVFHKLAYFSTNVIHFFRFARRWEEKNRK